MTTEEKDKSLVDQIIDTGGEYTGVVEAFFKQRPLLAVGISVLVGALLARKLLSHADRLD